MERRKAYSTDLTNAQWAHLRILLPRPQGKGRRRSDHQQRELIAMLYVNDTGCQWRELPHDFPAWQTVYGYYEDLVTTGVWQEINDMLRRGIRQQAGRDPASVVIFDSQSVKTAEKKESVADMMEANGLKDENDISQWM